MAIKTFTDGTALPASDINTYLANSGLVYVTQVTVPASPASSNVDVTTCFTSTFDNYLVSVQGVNCAAAGQAMTLNLLSGSTPAGSNWTWNTFYCTVGSTAGLTPAAQTGGSFTEVGSISNASGGNCFTFQIFGPYLAAHTRVTYQNADSSYFRTGAGVHTATTSYNGMRLSTYGSTVNSGTITVYGYRKG